MPRPGPIRLTLSIAAGFLSALAAWSAQTAESPQVIDGRRIATVNCGGCHAIGAGKSPLADAPSFRKLYGRYPPGGLEQLLLEGMLAGEAHEEAEGVIHPRMPRVTLDMDQTADLKTFLRSFEPKRRRRP